MNNIIEDLDIFLKPLGKPNVTDTTEEYIIPVDFSPNELIDELNHPLHMYSQRQMELIRYIELPKFHEMIATLNMLTSQISKWNKYIENRLICEKIAGICTDIIQQNYRN